MGTWLDTAIGLTFVYLLFSTIVSGIQEFIAWIAELRASTMCKELARLLADPSADALLKEFLAHPQVRRHADRVLQRSPDNAPSYLPRSAFSGALVDMLTGSSAREALPALREAFRGKTVPGAAAFAAVLALDDPAGESAAALGLENEILRATPAALDELRNLIAPVPQSILKACALAAVAPATTPDRRPDAIKRLARLIARRSPAVALQRGLYALPSTPVRNALVGLLEAGSIESRSAAVANVRAVVEGSGAVLTELQPALEHLPAGALKTRLDELARAATDGERIAATVNLTRLAVLDPVGELRHVASLLGPKSEIGRVLLLTLDRGAATIEDAHERIAALFDDAMEHCAAVYRRYVQLVLIVIAAVVTVGVNVDTLVLVRSLSANAPMRETVVAAATRAVHDPAAATTANDAATTANDAATTANDAATTASVTHSTNAVLSAQTEVDALALPIGWGPERARRERDVPWAWKVVGWLLTVIALSLGAPFWFGIVNRLVNLRPVGQPPRDEGSGRATPPSG